MDYSWVDWFLSQPIGKYFVKVDEHYLNNSFNLYGLAQKVPYFRYAYELIQGKYIPQSEMPAEWPNNIGEYAMILYGLIHSRYLLTSEGLSKMYEKYKNHEFENCPRVLCHETQCLPFGQSNDFGQSRLAFFCPNCNETYYPENADDALVDGSFFGNSWVHIFIQKYNHFVVPQGNPERFVPRLFGYRLYDE